MKSVITTKPWGDLPPGSYDVDDAQAAALEAGGFLAEPRVGRRRMLEGGSPDYRYLRDDLPADRAEPMRPDYVTSTATGGDFGGGDG